MVRNRKGPAGATARAQYDVDSAESRSSHNMEHRTIRRKAPYGNASVSRSIPAKMGRRLDQHREPNANPKMPASAMRSPSPS
jgi:hypothetical protein